MTKTNFENEHAGKIRLEDVGKSDWREFKTQAQRALTAAVAEKFGFRGRVPLEEDFRELLKKQGLHLKFFVEGTEKIGGAAVLSDEETRRCFVELFFLREEFQGRGLGVAAWKALERAFPRTRLWKLCTPYFEKRNIHFYVNKCGFRITEFVNARHRSSDENCNCPDGEEGPWRDELLVFEKQMPRSGLA